MCIIFMHAHSLHVLRGMHACLSCINTLYFIYRENFGDEIVDIEAFKKEVRTGPHEEMTLGEYIDVSTVYMRHTYTRCIWCGTYIYRHIHVRT